tara:strand:- start:9821 stop:10729 length:909 start_codon:yes stop_codon:yes gene_type:complete
MEFFNKKEDVLDIQLTEYGKSRLAIGKLDPTYYAFFDDDILYDVSGSGYTEVQNDIDRRIQENTPKLKLIRTRTGAETRVNEFLNNLETAVGNNNSDPAESVQAFKQQQPFAEKGKLAAYPLGRSSLKSQYNPAWTVHTLSTPQISGTLPYINNNDYIDNIPQLDITIDYKTYWAQAPLSFNAISDLVPGTSLYLSLEENYLMLEVIEENTDFEKENFNVQVFISESATGYIQKSYAVDNLTQFVPPSTNNVEYYMNILVDDEIPQEVLEELNIPEKAIVTNASRLRLNRDLYTTQNEEPCD